MTINFIVTGDDFGKSDDVNNNISFCHKYGLLTSASIVANGKAFDGAVKIASKTPTLDIGVHLAINEFIPICREPSSIINPKTNLFYPLEEVIRNIKTFKCQKNDLVKEYSLQIEKVMDCGISVTHIDHHHHLHLYWPVLNAVIEVSRKYGIRYVRSQKLIIPIKKKLFSNIYRLGHQLYMKTLKRHITSLDGHFELSLEEFEMEFEVMYERFVKLVNSDYKIVEVVAHPSKKNGHEVAFLTDERVVSLTRSCKLLNFGNI